jgi:hypothetical protein
MPASRVTASSALQVILSGKDQVRTVIVVIARLESHRSNRRLGRFILHTSFSQPFYAFNRKRELQDLGNPKGAQQVPPLRYASVGMAPLFGIGMLAPKHLFRVRMLVAK